VDLTELVSLEEAQRLVLDRATSLPVEIVRLVDGGGRVLAEEIRASRDEPPLNQAAMDGYAVHSADVQSASLEKGIYLTLVGSVAAGQSGKHTLSRGEAFRVMTGATLPDGSDAVIPQEMTESVPQGVKVTVPVAPETNLVPAGAEIHRNQHLISSGTVLQARELTILATQGHGTVKVRRQPVVAVLATGSELKEIDGSVDKGQVFASNLYTVSHLVNRYGGKASSQGIVGDDLTKLKRTIHKENQADVVVTTGGTGKGDKDLLPTAIDSLGGRLLFQGVAMSPGKQTLCAMVNQTLLIGLPGRPPAAFIAFQQLVVPILLQMLGISEVFLPEVHARLRHSVQLRGKGKAVSFLFSRLLIGPEGAEVESLRSRSRGMLAEMLAANSLIRVEPGKENLKEGERVSVQLLDVGLPSLSYFAES